MRYFPILKWKQGEQNALATLTSADKADLQPVIEIMPPPWNFEEEDWKKEPETQIRESVDRIAATWGTARIALDFRHFPADVRIGDQVHPLERAVNYAHQMGIEVIPTLSPNDDLGYRGAVRRVIEAHRSGLLLRVGADAFLEEGRTLDLIAKEVGAQLDDTDLLLDLGSVDASVVAFAKKVLPDVICRIPRLDDWRSVVLAAGSFPAKMTHSSGYELFKRFEWQVWKFVQGSSPRTLVFSDYGADDPGFRKMDVFFLGSANLRYTIEDNWLVYRGHTLRRSPGYEQFRAMCRQLIERPEYCGPSFSWGDSYIDRCAAGKEGPGNHSTWRKVATSHHIKFVLHQVASVASV